MNLHAVFYLLGLLLVSLALALLAPLGVAYAHEGPDLLPLAGAFVFVLGAGCALAVRYRQRTGFSFGRSEAFVLVTLSWFAASGVGALPWLFFKGPTFLPNAIFEGAAGFTTTGASILTDIESNPAGLLLWRSLTQWLGGMGIIVLGIAILPKLASGGVDLLSAEAPGPIAEKLTPRIARTAKALWGIYLLLTIALVGLLLLCGMGPFDAVNHALATLSTGGFSTKNSSVASFASPAIEWVICVFMVLAGVNFALFFHFLRARFEPLKRDPELRLYLAILGAATVAITLALALQGESVLTALRLAAFQVASIMTTTGFATTDYAGANAWPPLALSLLFLLTFSGACAGSTSGSVKVVRVLIVFKKGLADLRCMVQPHAVIPVRLGDRVIPPDVVSGVSTFLLLFAFFFALGGLALAAMGLDMITAFSASAACLGNVGPGLGSVGPAGNYAHVPALGKLILALLMILGRLELYTLLVLPFLFSHVMTKRGSRRPGRPSG